ncbi:MAG: sigma-70 family RNA polymerase sigma factor [Alphaproteobacteria bacterium]|nr:sigma-70 family RNA polymerase sigma factor [Alphaproteobacteria bacterium]
MDFSGDEDIWKDLAVRAQSGDARAFTELLRSITPYVRGVAGRGLANAEWVEDVTQDVLVSVYKSLGTYSSDRPFKPWLGAIISFRRTDFLRRYYKDRAHKQTSLDSPEFIEKHVTDSRFSGEWKDIEAALDTLPEKQRKVFVMLKIEGYSAKEVAKATGMSIPAVKVSAHRTLGKLKGLLK